MDTRVTRSLFYQGEAQPMNQLADQFNDLKISRRRHFNELGGYDEMSTSSTIPSENYSHPDNNSMNYEYVFKWNPNNPNYSPKRPNNGSKNNQEHHIDLQNAREQANYYRSAFKSMEKADYKQQHPNGSQEHSPSGSQAPNDFTFGASTHWASDTEMDQKATEPSLRRLHQLVHTVNWEGLPENEVQEIHWVRDYYGLKNRKLMSDCGLQKS